MTDLENKTFVGTRLKGFYSFKGYSNGNKNELWAYSDGFFICKNNEAKKHLKLTKEQIQSDIANGFLKEVNDK